MNGLDPARVLKAALAAQQPMLVLNIDHSSSSLAEFLGGNGADVIFIDCEQGDTSIQAIPDLVRAAHITATPAIVRLFSPQPWVIERYMLRNADGIVVPRVEDADEVRRVVETVRYCFPASFDRKSVIIQIETMAAVEHLDAILAVDGIDAVFIGPVDLAKSMGHQGDYRLPAVGAVIDQLIARLRRENRSVGMLVTADTVHAIAAKGVNFLYLHTNDFLLAGSRGFVAAKNSAGGAGT